MYVVRRAFRNYGQMMVPGSIIEPGNVKWFKTRLKDRYIVEVTEQTFPQWQKYFAEKLHVSLVWPKEPEVSKEPQKATKVVVKVNQK